MKYLYQLSCLTLSSFLWSQENSSLDPASLGVDPSLLDSSFFSGVLDQSNAGDDAMGTQRIVEQRESRFTPSILFSTNYNYNSNPFAAADDAKIWEDGFLTSFNFGFNLGLGEYGLGEDVLLSPSLYLSHSRTYYDLVKDKGSSNKAFDSDSQIVSFSLPFILPKDFILRLSHTYYRPIDFRNDKIDIYINSPSFSFEKQLTLPTGGFLNFSVGAGISNTNGSNYFDTITSHPDIDVTTANFMMAVLKSSEGVDPSISRPYNLQDSWNHQLQLSYIHPITNKLLAIPNFSFSKSVYTKGRYTGREDTITNFGLNFSYALKEWLNLSAVSNYSSKETNEIGRNTDIVDYKNFIGGVSFGINYAF